MQRSTITALVVGFLGTASLLALLYPFRAFVLDDSFITYRYAEHLAAGDGLCWNVGEDPVEGYTSFLWVVANAVGLFMGLDPVLFSKGVSVLAALGCIWLLSWAARRLHFSLAAIFVSALALSPAFAVCTSQGMETALTAFLVLLSARALVQVAHRASARRLASWFGWVLLSG